MSRLFQEVVRLRSWLYEEGHLRVHRLDHPVISIGNLTTGGTGKTPVVIAIATAFRDLGYRPVVLSRGYRRQSRGVVVVGRGQGPETDWRTAGDEPFLMALRLPGVAVVVGTDRFEAGRSAESLELGDLFILDDGFQHRRLFRDVDLVTIDPDDWHGPVKLLPVGRWREPREAVERADAVLVAQERDHSPVAGRPTFTFRMEVDGIVRNGELLEPGTLKQQPVVAFAGIAKPERFFRSLASMGLNVTATKTFRDHHAYRPEDIRMLPEGLRITTEKDAVRLGPGDFCFLRVSANILNFESLRDLILNRITRSGRS